MADKDSSCTISEKVRRVNIIRLVFQVDLCLEIEKFNYDRRQLLKIQNRNKFLKIMVEYRINKHWKKHLASMIFLIEYSR